MAQFTPKSESFIPKLAVVDQLILELVSGKQKKGGYITFGGPQLDSLYGIEYKMEGKESVIYSKGKSGKRELPPEAIIQFETELSQRNLYFKPVNNNIYRPFTSKDAPAGKQGNLELHHIRYAISHDENHLEELVRASTDDDISAALNAKSSDMGDFGKKSGTKYSGKGRQGEIIDEKHLAEAIRATVGQDSKIPEYYAYLFHLPDEWKLDKGKIAADTQELLKKYQTHVRANNQSLAERIENEFTQKYFPVK